MQLGELFLKLGVNVDDKGLKGLTQKISDLPEKIVNLKNAFVLATLYGLDRWVESTINGVVALDNLNKQTDLSVEKLQQWALVGQQANQAMNTEQITNGIANLQRQLTAIKFGQGDVSGFQFLGINAMGKDAFHVLDELRNKIKGVDNATASFMISRIGLDPNFINILRLTNAQFQEMSQKGLLNDKQRENLIKFGAEIKKIKLEFSLFKDMMVSQFLPMFKHIAQLTINLVHGFFDLTNVISKSKVAMYSLGLALAGVLALISPMSAIVVGLLLVFEDLYVFFTGKGKSMTGIFWDVIKKGFKSLAQEVLASFQEITDFFTKFKIPQSFIDQIDRFEKFVEKIKGSKEATTPKAMYTNFYASLKDLFPKGTKLDLFTDFISRLGVGIGDMLPAPAITNNYVINSTGNPQEIADAIVKKQQDTFIKAQSQVNQGSAY